MELRNCVAAAIAAAIILGGAASADAYVLSPEVDTEFDAIVQANYAGSAQPSPPTCSGVCQDLRAAESQLGGEGSPAVQELNSESRLLRIGTNIMPKLRVLGTIGMAAGTFDLGWKIGTGINAKFLHIGIDDSPLTGNYTSPQITFYTAGSKTPIWYTIPVPQDAWVWSTFSSNYAYQRSAEYWSSENSRCPSAGPPPKGFHVVASQPGYFCDGVTPIHRLLAYKPENELTALGPVETYTNQTYTRESGVPSDPGLAAVTASTRAQLESDAYPELNKKLEFELGTPNACDPVETFVCNPPSGSTDEQDRRCELSTPGNADPAPSRGTVKFSTPLYDEVLPFERATPDGGMTSTFLKYGWTRPSTKNGWAGWGYRHIYAKHGWGPDDITATATALAAPPAAVGTSRFVYNGPEYQQNGAVCIRRVVVAYQTENPSEPEPAGIVTSYGRYMREA